MWLSHTQGSAHGRRHWAATPSTLFSFTRSTQLCFNGIQISNMWLSHTQGSAHGRRHWAATPSTLIRRPPQQLQKTWQTEYFEYKNIAVL